jgi:TetR/AcrR family transcriptional regulator, ethionamide resistance regulator
MKKSRIGAGAEKSRRDALLAASAQRSRVRRRARKRMHLAGLNESEILEAAETLMQREPFSNVTVGSLMAEVGLARSAFYKYFRDLHDLLVRLAGRHLQTHLVLVDQLLNRHVAIVSGGQGVEAGREALEEILAQIFELYRKRYNLLRAIIEQATGVPEINAVRKRLLDDATRFGEQWLERFPPQGPAGALDRHETGRALWLLNESYMLDLLARNPKADAARAARTLSTLVVCAAYGELPAGVAPSRDPPAEAQKNVARAKGRAPRRRAAG